MTGAGHRVTGVLAALAATPWLPETASPVFVLLGAWPGATAPDWAELTPWGTRCIAHRRITHWLVLWLVLGAVAVQLPGPFGAGVTGFAIAGLTHSLTDLPNPAGVPIIHPWNKTSLRWWGSGQREPFLAIAFGAVAAISFWLAKPTP